VWAAAASVPARFLLDANILSVCRSLRLTLPTLLGCDASQIVVPLVAVDECLATTSQTHPRRGEYLRLLTGVDTLDTADPQIVAEADVLLQRYARHGAAIADMLIASAALLHSMTVVSTNWSDFHFVHDLWLLDARYLVSPARGPDLLAHSGPARRGPVLPAPPCCRGLVDAGVLPRSRPPRGLRRPGPVL
jgi:predicted nucleic acid-binding protein